MKRFCLLLSAILVAQVFCFVAENYRANAENLSEQTELGRDIL
ncbi:MAG: hypothetical protein ABFQ95_00110 [Pseudomonadota bacterium]